jgi:molybdenum cofactor cytidylyltransferase
MCYSVPYKASGQEVEAVIALMVLAAGQSSRMGVPKLLLPLGNRTVIAHVVGAALASRLRPVVVVLGHEADRLRAALPPGDLVVVENPAFATGLATSLGAGLVALPGDLTGVVVALADQPLLTSAHLDRMADAAETSGVPIVAASYGGRRGNPVYFSRAYFPELLAVTGDEGGRTVIARHADDVVLCELGDEGAGVDVDTPSDFVRMRALWEQR